MEFLKINDCERIFLIEMILFFFSLYFVSQKSVLPLSHARLNNFVSIFFLDNNILS